MRTLVAFCVAFLALPLAAAAQPGTSSALTLSASSGQIVYGHAVVLSGRLSGSPAAGRAVVLDAWPYGAARPHRLAVVTTDADGGWSYRARPTIQTDYQANAASSMSPRITVAVHPALAVAKLANGRLRVAVHAGHSLAGRFVQLQTGNADGSWTTVDRKRLSAASLAVLTPPAGTGDVRVAMSVNQAGAGYLGATSRRLSFEVGPVSLSPSALTVLYGHRVALNGRLASGRAGERVAIIAHPYGRPAFRLGVATTGAAGRFSFAANPTILTAYVARDSAGTSRTVVVDVRPTIVIRELGNGRVWAHVSSAAFLFGRIVELQQLSGTTWRTIARRPLAATSTATFFKGLAPSTTVRVAMSVNQAGAGYVGAASHPIAYRGI